MVNMIAFKISLGAFVRRDGKYWEACCPRLQVFSQGDSKEEAEANIREAVELWVESCVERNTLAEALQELGWSLIPLGAPTSPEGDSIEIYSLSDGDPFSVELTIPAYQAALLSGETSAAPC